MFYLAVFGSISVGTIVGFFLGKLYQEETSVAPVRPKIAIEMELRQLLTRYKFEVKYKEN